ncbi:LOW QUALITY PROTEIN: S-adenosyl-L-methionine-dependent methyltransferase, partial [Parasponia andersonii]
QGALPGLLLFREDEVKNLNFQVILKSLTEWGWPYHWDLIRLFFYQKKIFYFDLLIMAIVTGRDGSNKDWGNFFIEAGFTSFKITPIFSLRTLIEVFP